MNNDQRIKLGRKYTQYDDEDYQSDQEKNLPQPPLVKEAISDDRIDLPMNFDSLVINNDIISLLYQRQSHRIFSGQNISLLQLSFLLWATQGIKDIRGNNYATIRTVPCGGARHEFETYLTIKSVEGLKPGIYHYLPMEDQLEFLGELENYDESINLALMKQTWATKANLVFFWSLIPYRAEWRYGIFAHRVMMMDIGHIGENLYLACEALGLGTCGLGAFDRTVCNGILQLEEEQEYTVYASPVGTVNRKELDKKYLSISQKRKA